ncbi:hypothetical protein I4U30_22075 [Enterobacter asburiae]|uniref:hypothetical protein n=1 Tax=Enterobacter asburiae TaxID=61645 RepID=UPI00192C2818|nr:hypothetical protein [Enterobacter asburiae]MBL5840959.1 hypothetical protein [Enterobacter asburiae]
MKYEYRVITGINEEGKEIFISQYKPVWWPFWIKICCYPREEWSIEEMEAKKKIHTFKSKVVRLG